LLPPRNPTEDCTLPHCQYGCASQQIQVANVRFGSKADIARDQLNVSFAPKSGHWDSAGKALCQKRTFTVSFDRLIGTGEQWGGQAP
jgi:hypothetical protein